MLVRTILNGIIHNRGFTCVSLRNGVEIISLGALRISVTVLDVLIPLVKTFSISCCFSYANTGRQVPYLIGRKVAGNYMDSSYSLLFKSLMKSLKMLL